jgi:inorganic pyrophosphatase-like protein/2'-5' RNA ligase superfamily protein
VPLKTIHERLRSKLPEALRRFVPELPPAKAPAEEPERVREPPVDTSESSSYAKGPTIAPNPRMVAPDWAKHQEGHLMWNVGDPVEIDADPKGATGATQVDAVHVGGPPKRLTREQIDEGQLPYRPLGPGDVAVRNGAKGTVVGILPATLMVRVPKHEVAIREGALTRRELTYLDRYFDRGGGWIFGITKENAVPLKLETERVWARVANDDKPKSTISWRGHSIAIECPGGETRHPSTNFPCTLPDDWAGYGYFVDMPADDGDSLDAIVGPGDAESSLVFLAVQSDPSGDGTFVQWKVLLGFENESAARDAFLTMWPEEMFSGVVAISQDEFEDLVLPKLVVDEKEDAPPVLRGVEASGAPRADSSVHAGSGDCKAKAIVGDACPHCGEIVFERDLFGEDGRWFHRPCTSKGPIRTAGYARRRASIGAPVSHTWTCGDCTRVWTVTEKEAQTRTAHCADCGVVQAQKTMPFAALPAGALFLSLTNAAQGVLRKIDSATVEVVRTGERLSADLRSLVMTVSRTAAVCPRCRGTMAYSDGRDAYVCPVCDTVGPNGPARQAFTGDQREWKAGEAALHSSGESVTIVRKLEKDGGISAYIVRFTSGVRKGEQVAATPSALKPASASWDTARTGKIRVTAADVAAAGGPQPRYRFSFGDEPARSIFARLDRGGWLRSDTRYSTFNKLSNGGTRKATVEFDGSGQPTGMLIGLHVQRADFEHKYTWRRVKQYRLTIPGDPAQAIETVAATLDQIESWLAAEAQVWSRAGKIRVTAQEILVGPDNANPLEGIEPSLPAELEPTTGPKPTEPVVVKSLKLRNQQLYERAIAAGGREVKPGTVSMGQWGWIWHPALFGEIAEPEKYKAIVDQLEQRVTAFEQRRRGAVAARPMIVERRVIEETDWRCPHCRALIPERGGLFYDREAKLWYHTPCMNTVTLPKTATATAAAARDIVVSIPAAKRKEIEAEEADVAAREARGEQGITYYWEMGRLPKAQPRRIYFAWDGAVRAYHDVVGMSDGRIHMATAIHDVPPVPMESFRGFRYFEAPDSRSAYLREGKTPGDKAVVVIRIPQALARIWPEELEEENGPPHFTIAYVPGPHDDDAKRRLLAIVADAARETAPIPVELEKGVSWFTSDNAKAQAEGKAEIAHKTVHPETAEQMAALHWKIVGALEAAGFKPSVRDEFKAHSTIAYSATRDYSGPVPEGGFRADTVEVWGWEDTPKFKLAGKTVVRAAELGG